MEGYMDHKQTIGFTTAQQQALSLASRKTGLSFAAFVRSSAVAKAAELGVEVQQPPAD
jgi:hypothetical protein